LGNGKSASSNNANTVVITQDIRMVEERTTEKKKQPNEISIGWPDPGRSNDTGEHQILKCGEVGW